MKLRIGHGYDLHRLTTGRRLILSGVCIPYELGLLGHSDADVLYHAACDAVLGALALGDIGHHFPDNDQRFKDIDSGKLCREVCKMMHEHEMCISNMDVTVIAQKPKLAPHIAQMRDNLARVFDTTVDRINIKATTEEGLGATGDGLAIAAHCVVLLSSN